MTRADRARRRYPDHWRALVAEVRRRAEGRCECSGECGLHRTTPGPRRCEEVHGASARWARGRVVLTTAHLCQDSTCADLAHLRAMCQRCRERLAEVGPSRYAAAQPGGRIGNGLDYAGGHHHPQRVKVTTGWAPGCRCGRPDTVPCLVLDPFAGTGTAMLVAQRLGRRGVGVELNPKDHRLARARLGGQLGLL